MPKSFAAEDESLRRLLRLMHLVPGCLRVLHLRQLHVLTHSIKLLLGILELPYIPGTSTMKHKGKNSQIFGQIRNGEIEILNFCYYWEISACEYKNAHLTQQLGD